MHMKPLIIKVYHGSEIWLLHIFPKKYFALRLLVYWWYLDVLNVASDADLSNNSSWSFNVSHVIVSGLTEFRSATGLNNGPEKESWCDTDPLLHQWFWRLFQGPRLEAQHLHGVRFFLPKYGRSRKSYLPAGSVSDWKGTQGGNRHARLRQEEGCPLPDQRTEGLLPTPAGDVQPVHSHHLLPQPPTAALRVRQGAHHCGARAQLLLCNGPWCTVPR